MKIMILNNRMFALLLAAFAILTLPSCIWDDETPEPPLEESLVGTWDMNSYVLDGDEWMVLNIASASVTFMEPTSHSGIFTEEFVFTDGDTTLLSGRYIVDEERKQVTLYAEGEPVVVDIVITGGNKMVWESLQDQFPLVIKATKRK